MERTVKRRKWTISEAVTYVARVEAEKAPVGLKCCSARDYINGLQHRENGAEGGGAYGSGGTLRSTV